MTKAHIFWAAGWFIFCAPHVQMGTSIVVVLRRESITVGADSHTVGVNGERHPDNCKLWVSDSGMIFASAGFEGDGSGPPFSETGRQIAKGNRDISKTLDSLDQALRHRLFVLARAFKEKSPAYFAKEIENKPLYEAIFAVMGKDGPEYSVIDYIPVIDASNGHVALDRSKNETCTGGCAGLVTLGRADSIMKYAIDYPSYLKTHRPAGAIKFLIGLEIKSYPNYVGPPIAILQVTAAGPKWIDHGVCQ